MTAFLSIRNRLAALVATVVVVAGAVHTVSAYHAFRRAILTSAGERTTSVARQLSDLLGAQARQVRDQARAMARDSVVAQYLRAPDARTREALARAVSEKLATVDRAPAGATSVELWDSAGHRLLATRDTAPPIDLTEAKALIAFTAGKPSADRAEIGWIGSSLGPDGSLGYAVLAAGGPGASEPVTGFVVERRKVAMSAQSSAQLRDLIGHGTTLLVGNTRGDLWTNLVGISSGPPLPLPAKNTPVEYERPHGHPVLATLMPIPSTPWSVAIEMPMAIILSPIGEMLRGLALATLALVLVAGVATWFLSRSLTRPIGELVRVAEGMSAGDESERVTVRRLDELGVLGAAFNAMAERIAHSRASLTQTMAEHRDAEARVRATQERLESVIRSSGAVLCEFSSQAGGPANARAAIKWVSENVTDMFGYAPSDVRAEGWWSAHVHPEDQVQLSTRHEYGDGASEYRLRRKDGVYRWLREERRVVRRSNGDVDSVCAWLDITEQRQLADHLRQTQKMEAVGRLAGGVAHDFNNLLSVISGFSELLISEHAKRGGADPDHEALFEIKAAAARAAGLTRQLLAFSRQQVLRPHDIDLSAVVRSAEKMLQRLAGEDVTIDSRLADSLSTVFADPGQVEQVLVNLVVNARDAMPGGGTITIETRPATLDETFRGIHASRRVTDQTQYAALVVGDTGTGMSAEVRDRIFEPFFTTKEPGKGTGLGLSTVQGIVEQSGGQVFVYSEPGQGTTFKLYFPCAEGARDGRPVTPISTPNVRRGGSESILLVEDEPGVRRVTTAMLSGAGYSVIEAADGGQALKLCSDPSVPIDLVLTDMVMPVMGGRDLARNVRSERPGTPMVFISGYSGTSIAADAPIANAVFVEKPFTAAALLQAVREMLDRSRATQTARAG